MGKLVRPGPLAAPYPPRREAGRRLRRRITTPRATQRKLSSDPHLLGIFLEAAQNDNTVANVTHGLKPALTPYYGWLTANQDMAAALKAKGYHYRYIYAAGAGHADGNVVAQTLPEELLWLWRGYPIN